MNSCSLIVIPAEAAGEALLDLEEVVEADHVEHAGQCRLAADDGESTSAALQSFVGAEQYGEAGAVDVASVGEVDDQGGFTTAQFFFDMLFEQRGCGEVDIAPSGDDGFFAGVKRSKTK